MPPAPEPVKPRTAARDRRAIAMFALVALLVLAADLATKALAFRHVAGTPVPLEPFGAATLQSIPPHPEVVLLPRVLALRLTLNRGAAFGLGQGGRWLFVVVAAAAVAIMVAVFRRTAASDRLLITALALLLGGAIGNLFDRIVYGMVRDMCWLFPDVRLPFGWHWPGGSDQLYPWIFNVADVAMCVALGLFAWHMFRERRRSRAAPEPDPRP